MPVLQITHPVPDYGAWRAAFDSDPVGRVDGGVQQYRVRRSADDPQLVQIELDFNDATTARAFHAKLQQFWSGGKMPISSAPQVELFDDATG